MADSIGSQREYSMPRPNFFIVGAPKCGTTAWVSYLADHPEIGFASNKEPHYFSEDLAGFRWAETEEEYLAFFEDRVEPMIGEASVQYLYSKVAAENIKAFEPDAKIMIFLRDQKDFLPSYHNQLLYNYDETERDFSMVWKLARDGKQRELPASCREPALLDYLSVGRFDEQVRRYVETFPPNNIMVVRFGDWVRNPRQQYLAILEFLGLEDDGRDQFEKVHQAKQHRNNWLARFSQRPPAWVLRLADVLKKVAGRERLGLATTLRKVNQSTGYVGAVDDRIKAEITAHFVESNARLDALIEQLEQTRTSAGDA